MSNVRGKPFELGNNSGHGRPKGSQNKASFRAQELLNEHAEPVMRKCIVEALKGDRNALRLCVERIAPVRRDRCIKIAKLPTRTTADLDRSSQQVLHAIAGGQITPNEGESLTNILADRRHILETAELEPRLKALEQRSEDRGRTGA